MKFGFIGTGNMAGALVRALRKNVAAESVYLSNRTADKARLLADEVGGNVTCNETIARQCQVIFLGVKPNLMQSVLQPLSPILKERTQDFVLVSMASGISMADIQKMAAGNYPVMRIMPNTPAAIGEGMILYCCSDNIEEHTAQKILTSMSAAGRFDTISEHLMDAGSAVSGCGPAFVYLFIEALADGGVECGLSRKQAMEYAAQMVAGASKLLLETNQHPGALKDAVCSPGGSTIAGVHALENGAFRATVMNAVKAAFEKTSHLK